jgi:hypothetical protein
MVIAQILIFIHPGSNKSNKRDANFMFDALDALSRESETSAETWKSFVRASEENTT